MKEQVMAWVKQSGLDKDLLITDECQERLKHFAKLCGNAKLEEAKQLFSQPHQEYFGREAQDAIESLKEPTP